MDGTQREFNRMIRRMGSPFEMLKAMGGFPQETGGNSSTKLAVVLPTRGTIFSETVATVFANLSQSEFDFDLMMTTLPIPQAFNYLFHLAVGSGADYIWMVEDDIVPPLGALEEMVRVLDSLNLDVITADYPLDSGRSHIRRKDDAILYAGTGCMVVRANSLVRFPKPYFSTAWDFIYDEETKSFTKIKSPNKKWGGQDAYFYIQAAKHGLKVGSIPIICKHYRVNELGEHKSNRGLHKVEEVKWLEGRRK